MIDQHEDTTEEDNELEEAGEVSVGGGPSQLTNIVVLGLCILGVLYGLVSFLTAKGG